MAPSPPSQNPDEDNDRSAQAAQGRQDGGVVGQSSGRPSYGTGGYELNLNEDEPADESGSGSAVSSTSKAPHESSEDDDK